MSKERNTELRFCFLGRRCKKTLDGAIMYDSIPGGGDRVLKNREKKKTQNKVFKIHFTITFIDTTKRHI
jgi:hypothetical protein